MNQTKSPKGFGDSATLQMLALEPRILLDAALGATLAEQAADSSADPSTLVDEAVAADGSARGAVQDLLHSIAGHQPPGASFDGAALAARPAARYAADSIGLNANSVAENDASGALIGALSVTDPDAGDSHSFSVDDSRFEIVNGDQLRLKAGQALDFESEPSVALMITATDQDGVCFEQTLSVSVTDANEAPTGITPSSQVGAEGVAGAQVGVLSTLDPDAGDTFTYAVSDSRFEIQGDVLKLKDAETLDAAITPSVSLTLSATDQGGKSVSQGLTVLVDAGPGPYAPTDIALSGASVAENAMGAYVGTLSATDADSTAHTFTVNDSRFTISGSDLYLGINTQLDFEEQATVPLMIAAQDPDGQCFEKTFSIAVTNVNEAPADINLHGNVIDSSNEGQSFGQLFVIDPDDIATPQTHTLQIVDTASPFEIVNGDQLAVKSGSGIDYASFQALAVTVKATDQGGQSLTKSLSVQVNADSAVTNLPPTGIAFTPLYDPFGFGYGFVDENAPGAEIYQLSVTDPDIGDTHSFHISDPRFEVRDDGGGSYTLKLKDGVSLDFESMDSYTWIDGDITVIDQDGGAYSTLWDVEVLDLNEPPESLFIEGGIIQEGFSTSDLWVGSLNLRDPDFADTGSTVTFTLDTADLDTADFSIQNGNELHYHNFSVSYATTPSIEIDVKVQDTGGNIHSQPVTLVVSPTASYVTGDYPPTNITLSNSSVPENSAGAAIGDLSADDLDNPLDTHSFRVNDDRFIISGNTLSLAPGVALDHEMEPTINLRVIVTDQSGNSLEQALNINVTDSNEPPEEILFADWGDGTVEVLTGYVGGGAADGGSRVGSIAAYDPEEFYIGISGITVDDPRFEVGGIEGAELYLAPGVVFDYQQEPSTTITLTATDAQGLTSSRDFVIPVLPNIATPVYPPSSILLDNGSVAEESAGASVGLLSDPDDTGTQFTTNDGRFAIVGNQLSLASGISLDYEAGTSTDLYVTATNSYGASHTAPLTISVLPQNEAPAELTLSDANVPSGVSGALVGGLQFADPDGDSVASYMLSDARFEVVGDALYLKPAETLNSQTEPTVSLTVTAYDAGGLSVVRNFTLCVIPGATAAPTAIALDATTVAENSAGAAVGNVSVTDPTPGDSHQLHVNDSRFEVVGGVLKLKPGVSLDHETASSVSLTLSAVDSGGQVLEQAFTIAVANQNEPPTAILVYDANVDEQTPGAAAGTLSVVDPDLSDSVTFSVSGDVRFEVVGNVLKLKSTATVDSFAEASVPLLITATDSGGNSIQKSIAVCVTPLNQAPTDIRLSNTAVDENAAGAIIGSVTVQDPPQVTHTLTVSDPRFEVAGGQLKLMNGVALDYEAEPIVNLSVTAEDAGGLSITKAFVIQVNELNEPPTAITLDGFAVPENSPGASVGQLQVMDPDLGDSHLLTVDDPRFEVAGGELKLVDGVSLDFESEPTVTLNVTATDTGDLGFTQAFQLEVVDAPEAPSQITLDNLSVAENTPAGVVGQVHVLDPATGGAAILSVDDSRFELTSDGVLKLADGQALNYEAEPTVGLQITATNAAGLGLTQPFTIAVEDLNEAPTAIALFGSSIDDATPGAAVGAVQVSDPDLGDSHQISVNDSRFEVVNGILRLRNGVELDANQQTSLHLTLTATDRGGLAFSRAFTLDVTRSHQGPGGIALSAHSVPENQPGAVIGNLSVTSPYPGAAYSFSVADPRFVVNGDTLSLAPGVALDYEGASSVALDVQVQDQFGNQLTQNLLVQVEDLNEPPFIDPAGPFEVNENDPGAVIGPLNIGDPDLGDRIGIEIEELPILGAREVRAQAAARFEVVDGQLKLVDGVALDAETEPLIRLLITVTDQGGLSNQTPVTLNVLNVNEPPIWIDITGDPLVENQPGLVIGQIQVVDPDLGDQHQVVVLGNEDLVVENGVLRLADGVRLDFEQAQTLSFSLQVTDLGGLSYTQQYRLAVSDVNENPPPLPDADASPEPPPLRRMAPMFGGLQSMPLVTASVRGDQGAMDTFYGSFQVLTAAVRGQNDFLDAFYGSHRDLAFNPARPEGDRAPGEPAPPTTPAPDLGLSDAAETPPDDGLAPPSVDDGAPGLDQQLDQGRQLFMERQERILDILRKTTKLVRCGA